MLDVEAHPRRLSLRLDLVLTPDHPAFTPPGPGEQFCYRTGTIDFGDVEHLSWSGQLYQPATDASGEIDFGHIDTFGWSAGEYRLIGDFGTIDLRAGGVSVAC